MIPVNVSVLEVQGKCNLFINRVDVSVSRVMVPMRLLYDLLDISKLLSPLVPVLSLPEKCSNFALNLG